MEVIPETSSPPLGATIADLSHTSKPHYNIPTNKELLVRFSLKPKCSCDSTDDELHFLSCDLFYVKGKVSPRKRKRFFFFYPLKTVR